MLRITAGIILLLWIAALIAAFINALSIARSNKNGIKSAIMELHTQNFPRFIYRNLNIKKLTPLIAFSIIAIIAAAYYN